MAGKMANARVVHCKKEPYDIYIGRPSKWGNPFVLGVHGDRDRELYEEWLLGIVSSPHGEVRPTLTEARKELAGKVLGCWCKPHKCHGDVLLKFLNNNEEIK